MRILDVNHYVDKLAKEFPEVDEKSIKDIITTGNMSIYNILRKTTATIALQGKVSEDEHRSFIMYRHNHVAYNNKAKVIQRKKDKEDGK